MNEVVIIKAFHLEEAERRVAKLLAEIPPNQQQVFRNAFLKLLHAGREIGAEIEMQYAELERTRGNPQGPEFQSAADALLQWNAMCNQLQSKIVGE